MPNLLDVPGIKAYADKYKAMSAEERATLRAEVEQEKELSISCHVCRDAGFVHPVINSKPDYSRAIPCQCRRSALDAENQRRQFDLAGLNPNETDLLNSMDDAPGLTDALLEATALADGDDSGTLWLTIIGAQGNGKTHLARGIAQRCLRRKLSTRFCYCPELLSRLKKAMALDSVIKPENIIDDLVRVDLLVLDDLAGFNTTDWQWAQWEEIIGRRYKRAENGERCLLVVTTNKSPHEVFPKPIYSRLRDNKFAKVVTNKAPDYRPAR